MNHRHNVISLFKLMIIASPLLKSKMNMRMKNTSYVLLTSFLVALFVFITNKSVEKYEIGRISTDAT